MRKRRIIKRAVFRPVARLKFALCRRCWHQLRGVPQRDAEGRVARWYILVTDIDERKKAEEGLRRSEAYLTEAQRLSLTGSFGCRLSTGEMFWSDETFRIYRNKSTGTNSRVAILHLYTIFGLEMPSCPTFTSK